MLEVSERARSHLLDLGAAQCLNLMEDSGCRPAAVPLAPAALSAVVGTSCECAVFCQGNLEKTMRLNLPSQPRAVQNKGVSWFGLTV